MKNKTSFTECLAAYITIFIFLFPDVSASAHALSQKPWQEFSYESASVYSHVLATNDKTGDFHAVNAMSISGDVQTVFLGGHANDALNKPTDDVIGFEIENWDLETNAHITFLKSKSGPVGVTINGQHYFDVKGSSLVVSSAFLGEGHNTVLFSSTNGQPVAIQDIRFSTTSLSADGVSVLEPASPENFTINQLDQKSQEEDNNTLLGFALKNHQTAAIPLSLSNVTRGATAYRSSQQDPIVSVKIGVYQNMSESQLREAQVMFFDYKTKSWQQAFVKNVDHANFMIEADVPGGTDYFAAMIKTPEMPEASAFMPTAISDLEPKTPAEGINLIQPPKASQQGDANISYPIAIPQGRQGMTPQVSLNYSSSGGSSWAGFGWSIPVQSISVDTRWGVPSFDSDLQTEVYTLDGESLHEEGGAKANRPNVGTSVTYAQRSNASKRQFFPKQQSSYREIVRHGSSTSGYHWVVTDANGNKNYYGCTDVNALDNNAVLKTSAGHVTKWYLKKTEDRFGNSIIYTYKTINHAGTELTGGGKTVYLEKIEYTGVGNTPGLYSVHFVTSGSRTDTRINYTSGVKEVDDRKLNKIEVRYDGTLVKDYRLSFVKGDFEKTLLAAVGEYHNSIKFYEHKFTYNQVGTIEFAATPEIIKLSDVPTLPLLENVPFAPLRNKLSTVIQPSMIKTSETQGWSAGGGVGVGITPAPVDASPTKTWTFNGKLNYSESYTHDKYTFQDVNGDGLQDLIEANSSNSYYTYRAMKVEDNGDISFGPRKPMEGDKLYKSTSQSISTGVDYVTSFSIFNGGLNWNNGTSKVSRYLLDYNGDGILDRVVPVSGGQAQVEFGVLLNDGTLTFESHSQNTLNPVVKDASLQAYQDPDLKSFEVVRIWKAPVEGQVQITSNPQFILGVTGSVKVSIQHNDDFIQNPVDVPAGSGYYSSSRYMQKGDVLVFRLAPDNDGQKDFVAWNPQVSYTGGIPDDGNSSDYATSSFSDGFVLSGAQGIQIKSTDQIKVSLNRTGVNFSDDVYYRIIATVTDTISGNTYNQVFVDRLDQSASGYSNMSAPFIGTFSSIPNIQPNEICDISFEVFAHSNVDWNRISFRPEVEIKTDCQEMQVFTYPNVRYGMYNNVKSLQGAESLSLAPGDYEVSPVVFEDKAGINQVFDNVSQYDLDQTVFFVVKSGGKTISKKAVVLHKDQAGTSGNYAQLYTIDQATGQPHTLVNPMQYTGAATAVFNSQQVAGNDVSLEFFAEESPFAHEAIKYVQNNLMGIQVIDYSNNSVVSYSSGSNINMFYGEADQFGTRQMGWGQFAWSGDPMLEIYRSQMVIAGTNGLDPTAGPVDGVTEQEFEATGINPWEDSFFTMAPVRGDNAVGLWSYELQSLSTIQDKDHYAVFGSHMGVYRNQDATVPGIMGEMESDVSSNGASSSYYAANGSIQVNKSNSLSGNVGAGPFATSTSIRPNDFYSTSASMFQDFNGDGYPDQVYQVGDDVKVQFTNPSGGHATSEPFVDNEMNSIGHSDGSGITYGGSYKNEDIRFTSGASFGINFGGSYQEIEYADVNGDGLTDRVYDFTNQVALNTGRGFEAKKSYTLPVSSLNQSTSAPPSIDAAAKSAFQGASARISVLAESFTAGIGINSSGSRSTTMGMDLNGDGLSDIIEKVGSQHIIHINTGTGYTTLKDAASANVDLDLSQEPGQSQSYGLTGDIAGTLGFPIAPFAKMSVSANGGANYAINKSRSTFMDINGDGAIDFVEAMENGDLHVYYSNVVKSNYLVSVDNPLGGSFDIEYKLVGHKRGGYEPIVKTHRATERMLWDMPSGKWVMSAVTIHDGLDMTDQNGVDLDGVDETKMFFEYDGGIQNRREKEFAGFTRVETRQQNQAGSENSYPKKYITEVIEYFAPSELDFNGLKKHSYQKGLVQGTYSLFNEETNSSTHTVSLISAQNSTYEHRIVDINSSNKGQVRMSGSSWMTVSDWDNISETQTLFPAVTETEALNYPQIADAEYHSQLFELEYDKYFNVVRYQDKADMIPLGITEEVVDTLVSINTLVRVQRNDCIDLLNATPITLGNGMIGYHILPDPGYSDYTADTVWFVDQTGDCPPSDVYGMDVCAIADTDTYVTHHYKDETITSYTYKTVTNATYQSDRIAVMDYYDPSDAAGRTGVLRKHTIYVGNIQPNNIVRESEVVGLTTDKKSIKSMRTTLDVNGNYANTDLTYDSYGNVLSITGAENHAGQRAMTSFTYDNTVKQFVETVTNQFGESVCNKYDPATGLLLQSIGINGHPMVYQYDQFDRIQNIWAPKEIYNSGSAPTISYEYTLYSPGDGTPIQAVAITKHNLATANSNLDLAVQYQPMNCGLVDLSGRPAMTQFVRTATIVDGMGKAAQIHADQSGIGGATKDKFLVSGPQTLDKFGRLFQSYADVFISAHTFGELFIEQAYTSNDLMQRNVAYDYNSRPLSSESWGAESVGSGQWTTTDMQYGWNNDLNGSVHYFEKSFVASNSGSGNLTPDLVAANYTDARGRKIGQITYGNSPSDNIVTSFLYNEIGELMQITDPIGAITTYTYDLAGRVLEEDHPDRGITTTIYDNASNVTSIETPATIDVGGVISMSYDYNRLLSKTMPNSGGLDLYDIEYVYGSKGDGKNGAGRIVEIKQGQTFKVDHLKYDELGQVSEEDVTINVPVYGPRNFVTAKHYDSFGRILQATYPDEDEVDYGYNSNGELVSISSTVNSIIQNVISSIEYNGYGQISKIDYGNGTSTSYSYDAGNTKKQATLMGSTVEGFVSGNTLTTTLLDRQYEYNKQGMVSKLDRDVHGSLLGSAGSKSFSDSYTYDAFGRFESHNHSQSGQATNAYSYTLDMDYNKAGGILSKDGTGVGFQSVSSLNYDLQYNYNGANSHQLVSVQDLDNNVQSTYNYNSSGSIELMDDPSMGNPQEFFWNEEQQLVGVSNDQGIHHYVYDHKGERIMKSSVLVSKVYINDETIDEVQNLDPYTVYVNPYYVITGMTGGDKVSKHYYMNTQRVATDISINYTGEPDSEGLKKGVNEDENVNLSSLAIDNLNSILGEAGKSAIDESDRLSLTSIQVFYPDLVNTATESNNTESSTQSRIMFWYHPDYLGNVDLITEKDGNSHEFFMYNPWGEQMHQWNSNTYSFSSPYRFNGKEFDPETGLTYYGTRYNQSKLSLWLSVDPKATSFPSLSPYSVMANNPLTMIDPGGDSTYLVFYGAGYLSVERKGQDYDVGRGFKLNAEAKKAEIESMEGFDPERDEVILVETKNSEDFFNATNKVYDSGKIASLDVYSHGYDTGANLGGDKAGMSLNERSVNTSNLSKIDADNFEENVTVTLHGCNMGNGFGQDLVDHLGKGTVRAFDDYSEFSTENGDGRTIIYNGKMIKSSDRASQEANFTEFKPKKP